MMQNFKLKVEKEHPHSHRTQYSISLQNEITLSCRTGYTPPWLLNAVLRPVQRGDMSPNWNINRTAYLSVNISTERHIHLVPCETTQVSLTWQTKVQYKKVYQNSSTEIKPQYQKPTHKQILHAINYANANNSCMEWIIKECIVYTQVQIFIKRCFNKIITYLLFACIFN